jgi:WD40 repeat protein
MVQGEHADAAEAIVFSPDGRTLASIAPDHTLRFWDVETRRLLRVVRMAKRPEGDLVWLDGNRVAITVAGGDEDQVEVIERATGRVIDTHAAGEAPAAAEPRFADDDGAIVEKAGAKRRFAFAPRHDLRDEDLLGVRDRRDWWREEKVTSIAVSPDGRALAGTNGPELIVWDLATGKRRFRMAAPVRYVDRAWPPWLDHVTWSPDGRRLAVADYDAGIFLVDAGTGRMQGRFGAPILNPMEVHFVDDDRLAIRSLDTVALWSLREARRVSSQATTNALAIGRDHGELAIALGTNGSGCGDDARPIEIASTRLCLPFDQYAGLTDVDHLRVIGTPTSASGYRYREMSVIDTRGAHALRTCNEPRAIAEDGRTLVGAELDGETACAYDFATGKDVTIEKKEGIGAVAVARDSSEWALATGKAVEIYALPSNQLVRRVEVGATVSQLAYGPDHLLVAGTTDGALAVVGRDRVWLSATSQGVVLDLVVSPDGKRAVATDFAAAEVWMLAPDAAPRAAVTLADFVDDEWMASTPNGAFSGTLEVADRVGWVFDDVGQYFGIDASPSSRDPRLVQRRLAGEDVDAPPPESPPIASIVEATATGTTARLRVHAASAGRVDRVRAFVDGRPAAEQLVCARDANVDLSVPLGPGLSSITVIAFDEKGRASNPAAVQLRGALAATRPDVWVVAVGIDRYPRLPPAMQLEVATSDARSIAKAFSALAGAWKPYANAHVQLLTDEAATPEAIARALGQLHDMRPEDVAIVFLGGHGLKPSATADMVFATSAIDDHDLRTLQTATVGWPRIGDALARARGRVLVLLDACHSGHLLRDDVLPNDALADDLVRVRRAGVVVFAAAKGRQSSYEPSGTRGFDIKRAPPSVTISAGHGLFTGAVLDSLASAATDRDDDGQIELQELVDDVTLRVSTTTRGLQTPWVARREIFGDFALAPAAPGPER